MELRHLRYFAAVAELLSFRRAAERLHVSQPTLTRQLQALEQELGSRLLQRGRRREVMLTAAGRSFLSDAQQILATATEAKGRARAAQDGESRRLNLANIAALSAGFLPGCLRAFHAGFPQIEVCLFEMERAEQLIALREGRIHLGLFPCLGAPLESGLDSQFVWSCPMVAVLPAGHALARKSEGRRPGLDIHALASEPLIVLSREVSPGYLERLELICAQTGFRPASKHPVEGLENALGMVAAGYGATILPETMVAMPNPLYVAKRLRAPVAPLELKLLWRRDALTRPMQNFLTTARQCRE